MICAKQIVLFISLVILSAIAFIRCGSNGSLNIQSSVDADSIVMHNDRAFSMMEDGRPFEEYIAEQMEAVDAVYRINSGEDAVLVLSQTGWFFIRHGDYMEAMRYLQEASDSIKSRREMGELVDISAIRTLGNLSNLYSKFGLFENSLEKNAEAISLSRENNNTDLVDCLRFRSAIYSDMMGTNSSNRKILADSSLKYLDIAWEMIDHLPDNANKGINKKRVILDRATLFVEHNDLFPDSLLPAIKILEEYTSQNNPKALTALVMLGRAYVLAGINSQKGIRMMENALDVYRSQNSTQNEEWTLNILADSYVRTGDALKLAKIYPQVISMKDSLLNSSKINAVIGADFKYRLSDMHREAAQLQRDNERKHRLILYLVLALAVGLICGAALALFTMKVIKMAKMDKARNKHIIEDILSKQAYLNQRIESLTEELEVKSETEVVDKVTQSLDPTLLSDQDAETFRRAFVAINPHFLRDLRNDYPMLTSNDEMVCMLIYLKVPPVDMAMTLGISRMSLNSARYRIRKKLSLDKETDLDTFITSRKG